MPLALQPNTKAIGNAIVSYLAALTKPDTTAVYKVAQLEVIYDVITQVSNGGAVVEVYGNTDDSERRGFGGRIWDEQEWYILSLCSRETATLASYIYDVRDFLVVPFQVHATLGTSITNLFHAQFKPKSGRFMTAIRDGQILRAHLITLITRQEWGVPIPPGVLS
jgi:hypothetical protein